MDVVEKLCASPRLQEGSSPSLPVWLSKRPQENTQSLPLPEPQSPVADQGFQATCHPQALVPRGSAHLSFSPSPTLPLCSSHAVSGALSDIKHHLGATSLNASSVSSWTGAWLSANPNPVPLPQPLLLPFPLLMWLDACFSSAVNLGLRWFSSQCVSLLYLYEQCLRNTHLVTLTTSCLPTSSDLLCCVISAVSEISNFAFILKRNLHTVTFFFLMYSSVALAHAWILVMITMDRLPNSSSTPKNPRALPLYSDFSHP